MVAFFSFQHFKIIVPLFFGLCCFWEELLFISFSFCFESIWGFFFLYFWFHTFSNLCLHVVFFIQLDTGFLNLWSGVLHHINLLAILFQNIFLHCSFFSFWNSNCTCVRIFHIVLQISNGLFFWKFLTLVLFWLLYIALSSSTLVFSSAMSILILLNFILKFYAYIY